MQKRRSNYYKNGYTDGKSEMGIWTNTKASRVQYLEGKMKGVKDQLESLRESMMEDLLTQKVRQK